MRRYLIAYVLGLATPLLAGAVLVKTNVYRAPAEADVSYACVGFSKAERTGGSILSLSAGFSAPVDPSKADTTQFAPDRCERSVPATAAQAAQARAFLRLAVNAVAAECGLPGLP